MAAILPFLETQNDPAYTVEEQKLFRDKRGGVRGVPKGLGKLNTAALESEVLNSSHSTLLEMAWVRRAVELQLHGRPFHVQAGDITGANKRDVFLVLDEPVGAVPAWNPPGEGTAKQFRLLSWTSKMGTPSFSLPAGAPAQGGSCPGAQAAQSIVPLHQLRAASEHVTRVTGQTVDLSRTICQYCYAEGSRYGSAAIQYGQVARFIWARHSTRNERAVREEFVPVMDYAVKNANYLLEGGVVGTGKEKKTYQPERIRNKDGKRARFFRLHDSGDFFTKNYLLGWKLVADLNPDIIFWAPSRMWAASENGRKMVNEVNGVPRNLIIRPSAYMIDTPPPPLDQRSNPGWAAGTVVWVSEHKPAGGPRMKGQGTSYDWDCQTYLIDNATASCRNALAPDGKEGCRACWVDGTGHALDVDVPVERLRVNYTLHTSKKKD